MPDTQDQSMRELVYRLIDMAPEAPRFPEEPTVRVTPSVPAGSRRRLGPLPVAALTAVVVLVVAASIVMFSNDTSGPPAIPPPATSTTTVPPTANGWIAFTVADQPIPSTADWYRDYDIWLVSLDEEPRRVVGTDTDLVSQMCPAFSPDGRSLAYGTFEGHGTGYSVDYEGDDRPAAYRESALVVADVSDDGQVSDRFTAEIGDGLPPPCPVWSPDGGRVAFGVPRTSPVNPETTAAGSEVWVVTVADGGVTVLSDLLTTDLEWSPVGDLLAIASGADELSFGSVLGDGRIHLYDAASGAMRTLDSTLGAVDLTWSPDGRLIAYSVGDSQKELRLIDIYTEQQQVLSTGYEAIHGIGPIWSPDGGTIAYQRLAAGCRECHEVVLLTPGDLADVGATPGEVVIPPPQVTVNGATGYLFPFVVTWSLDGVYLLYRGWMMPDVGEELLVAVPIDPTMATIVLFEGEIGHDGYPDTTFVPIQTWGRRP